MGDVKVPYAVAYGASRKPAWRYSRAQQLVKDRVPPHPSRDDSMVKGMRTYLKTRQWYRNRISDADELEFVLADRFKHVWNAERIFSGGDDSRSRYELESLILARQPISKIADRLSVDKDTVVTYERVFFNVADKIDSRGFIVANAIMPTFMSGLSNRTPAGAAKYFSYFAGVHALNAILDSFSEHTEHIEAQHDWEGWASAKFRETFATSAVVSIMYMEPTNFNVRSVLEGFYNLIALSHREQMSVGSANSINAAFEVFATSNPQLVGSEADKNTPAPRLTTMNPSIEPRVSDYLELASKGKADVESKYDKDKWVPPDKRRVLDLKAKKSVVNKGEGKKG